MRNILEQIALELESATAKERGEIFDLLADYPESLRSRRSFKDRIPAFRDLVIGASCVDRALAEAFPGEEVFRVNILKAERCLQKLGRQGGRTQT